MATVHESRAWLDVTDYPELFGNLSASPGNFCFNCLANVGRRVCGYDMLCHSLGRGSICALKKLNRRSKEYLALSLGRFDLHAFLNFFIDLRFLIRFSVRTP